MRVCAQEAASRANNATLRVSLWREETAVLGPESALLLASLASESQARSLVSTWKKQGIPSLDKYMIKLKAATGTYFSMSRIVGPPFVHPTPVPHCGASFRGRGWEGRLLPWSGNCRKL